MSSRDPEPDERTLLREWWRHPVNQRLARECREALARDASLQEALGREREKIENRAVSSGVSTESEA